MIRTHSLIIIIFKVIRLLSNYLTGNRFVATIYNFSTPISLQHDDITFNYSKELEILKVYDVGLERYRQWFIKTQEEGNGEKGRKGSQGCVGVGRKGSQGRVGEGKKAFQVRVGEGRKGSQGRVGEGRKGSQGSVGEGRKGCQGRVGDGRKGSQGRVGEGIK